MPVDPSSVVTSVFNLPAVFIVLACTGLLILGVSESATVNNIIVAIKVTVILAFIAVGAFFVNPDNWHPFIPEPTGVENQFGIAGVIRAATIVFFAYIGFEAVSTAGQEAKDPREGHAHRHPGLAGGVHGAVHGDRRGAHGRGLVHQAQCGGAGRHRRGHVRSQMELAGQAASRSAPSPVCLPWCWY